MYKFDLKNNPELAREHKRASNRAYYARNRTKLLEAHKQWRKDNPGYDAQWWRDMRALKKEVKKCTDTL